MSVLLEQKKMALARGAYDEWRVTPAPDFTGDLTSLEPIAEGLELIVSGRTELFNESVVKFLLTAKARIEEVLSEIDPQD